MIMGLPTTLATENQSVNRAASEHLSLTKLFCAATVPGM